MPTPRGLVPVLIVTAVLAGVSLSLVSCGDSSNDCPTSPVAAGLGVAVGGRANSPRPAWPAALNTVLEDLAEQTWQEHEAGRIPDRGVTLVRADGAPTIGCVVTMNPGGETQDARDANRRAFLQAVPAQTAALAAEQEQANPLAALSVAAAAAGAGGTVALIDSGLQTVAPLDFTAKGLLDADIDRLVDDLDRGGALPDLRDRKVVLVGIGYTAPPQTPLDEKRKSNLIELWQKIVMRAGATSLVVVATPNTDKSAEGLPEVTPVPLPAPSNPPGCDTRWPIGDDEIGFRANSTEIIDMAKARRVVKRFADWLVANPSGRAQLVGNVAHHGADNPDGLSRRRAEAVKRILVDLGADSGQVSARGGGWGPFPTKAAPPDPVSDPRNRRVVITLRCG